jgi:pyruvate dehydrogenase E2 component (dihydrolipoamide acetyltransferase)
MSIVEVKVPDIGDFKDVEVIELMVKPGDTIKVDQSLVTVESDKASMEIPSSHAGVVKDIRIKVGDKINEGTVVLTVEAAEGAAAPAAEAAPAPAAAAPAPAAAAPAPAATPAPTGAPAAAPAPAARAAGEGATGGKAHASPSIRKFARELGVDLTRVPGTGPKGRITQQDVHNFVKGVMAGGASAGAAGAAGGAGIGGINLLPWPSLDFSKFGPTELLPLSRIKKISGPNLHRNWVMIPHVTQFDEADVTGLEQFRVDSNASYAKAKSATKLTMLAFVIKASVAALKKYPQFNASIDEGGANLILKQYYNIGFAADTPNGLVVPVVKDADSLNMRGIAKKVTELAGAARSKKLGSEDMKGSTFTITNPGPFASYASSPIINQPNVAILCTDGVKRRPVAVGDAIAIHPTGIIGLVYDHRAFDGSTASLFLMHIRDSLEQRNWEPEVG